MFDLVDRPDFVHAAVDRMVAAWNTELDQFVALNLLTPDGNNTRIGSGGFGYTKDCKEFAFRGRPLKEPLGRTGGRGNGGKK